MSLGTPAEHKFKEVVRSLVRQGTHPTAIQLNLALGRNRPGRMNNLNGREASWRRELVPGWVATYGRDVKIVEHCKLFCCETGGGFPPDDVALTCSNGHLELVRLTEAPGVVFWASGGDRCSFCDERRDLVEVQGKIGNVIGRSVERSSVSTSENLGWEHGGGARMPLPPTRPPATIQMGLPVGDSPVMIVGFIAALAIFFAFIILLIYFYG